MTAEIPKSRATTIKKAAASTATSSTPTRVTEWTHSRLAALYEVTIVTKYKVSGHFGYNRIGYYTDRFVRTTTVLLRYESNKTFYSQSLLR